MPSRLEAAAVLMAGLETVMKTADLQNPDQRREIGNQLIRVDLALESYRTGGKVSQSNIRVAIGLNRRLSACRIVFEPAEVLRLGGELRGLRLDSHGVARSKPAPRRTHRKSPG